MMTYEKNKTQNKKYEKRYEKLVNKQVFNKDYIKDIKATVLDDKLKAPNRILETLRTKSKTHKKDKFFGIHHRSDKNDFKLIEDDLDELSSKMNENIPQDSAGRYNDIEKIDKLYSEMIGHCTEYIVKHCRFTITKEAKNRKYLVQYLLSYCKKERNTFKAEALETLNISGSDTQLHTWNDVLAESRIQHIDITDREDIGKEGAATSDILTFGEGKDKKFFKDEEKLMTVNDKIDELFHDVGKFLDEDDKSKLKNFPNLGMEYYQLSDEVNRLKEQKIPKKNILLFVFNTLSDSNWDKLNSLNESQINQLFEMVESIIKSDTLHHVATVYAGIADESTISNRNVATSRMADLLGLGDIVAKSKKAKITQKGQKSRIGNLMNGAQGIAAAKLMYKKKEHPELNFHITVNAKKQLMALQVLDTICGQIDRHLNNYFVSITEEGKDITIDSIQGIDNDLSFGNMQIDSQVRSNLPAFIDKSGQTVFNHMDRGLSEKVLGLSPDALKFIFADLLSTSEIEALNNRLEIVKTAIQSRIDKPNSEFLKDSNSFANSSAKELSSGDSYLSILCKALRIQI